jgi:hypothetical protein
MFTFRHLEIARTGCEIELINPEMRSCGWYRYHRAQSRPLQVQQVGGGMSNMRRVGRQTILCATAVSTLLVQRKDFTDSEAAQDEAARCKSYVSRCCCVGVLSKLCVLSRLHFRSWLGGLNILITSGQTARKPTLLTLNQEYSSNAWAKLSAVANPLALAKRR